MVVVVLTVLLLLLLLPTSLEFGDGGVCGGGVGGGGGGRWMGAMACEEVLQRGKITEGVGWNVMIVRRQGI